MDLIQTHLDRIAQNWNTHAIRPQKNNELNYGKPDVMFYLPELFDSQDFGTNVDIQDVICCQRMYSIPKNINKDFKELAKLLKPDLQMAHDAETALQLFFELNKLVWLADNLRLKRQCNTTTQLLIYK